MDFGMLCVVSSKVCYTFTCKYVLTSRILHLVHISLILLLHFISLLPEDGP
jgi:hypothetical protein